MAELGKRPRATKDGGLYQGHRATPRWNWGRASLKTFPTLCGEGVLAETVQAEGWGGPAAWASTVALAFETGKGAR